MYDFCYQVRSSDCHELILFGYHVFQTQENPSCPVYITLHTVICFIYARNVEENNNTGW